MKFIITITLLFLNFLATSQTWMKGYESMLVQDSCRRTEMNLLSISGTRDYILTFGDSIYRIDKDGDIALRFSAERTFGKNLVRFYKGRYYTASKGNESDRYLISKYDNSGVFLDSFQITAQQTNIGGLEIEDNHIIVFSIGEKGSSLDYFELDGNKSDSRSFNINWTHPNSLGIIMKSDSTHFYINTYYKPWGSPDPNSSLSIMGWIPKLKQEDEYNATAHFYRDDYFEYFSIDSMDNVYTVLGYQGIRKLRYGIQDIDKLTLNGIKTDSSGNFYDGYTRGVSANGNLVAMLDYPYYITDIGHRHSSYFELYCMSSDLLNYTSHRIPFENPNKDNQTHRDWVLTSHSAIEGSSILPNEIGGFTILLIGRSTSEIPDCDNIYPIIIKTDSTCNVEEYEVYGSVDSVQTKMVNIHNDLINIYPNPTNGILSIESDKYLKNASVSIYSIMGQLIKADLVTGSDHKIDIIDRPPGVYIIRLETSEGVWTGKVVKGNNF